MAVLLLVCWPGLILWAPVFIASSLSARRFKTSGPKEDVWDEIAQQKLLVGVYTGICVWLGCVLLTLPMALMTFFLIPPFMWLSLRFFEDMVSSFRAIVSLVNLMWIGPVKVKELSEKSTNLYGRVMTLAIHKLKLPADPKKYFLQRGGREKGRVRGNWESKAKYFSITRRRKRDVSILIVSKQRIHSYKACSGMRYFVCGRTKNEKDALFFCLDLTVNQESVCMVFVRLPIVLLI